MSVKRIFAEKKPDFAVKAKHFSCTAGQTRRAKGAWADRAPFAFPVPNPPPLVKRAGKRYNSLAKAVMLYLLRRSAAKQPAGRKENTGRERR